MAEISPSGATCIIGAGGITGPTGPIGPAMAENKMLFEPRREKTGLLGFRPGATQIGLYSHRSRLDT